MFVKRNLLFLFPCIAILSCTPVNKEIQKEKPNFVKPFRIGNFTAKNNEENFHLSSIPIEVSVKNIPLSALLVGICKSEGLSCDYSSMKDLSPEVSITYKGTLRGLLDYLQTKYGILFSYEDGILKVSGKTPFYTKLLNKQEKGKTLSGIKVSLNLEKVPLSKFLDLLSVQTGFIFVPDKGVNTSEQISIKAKNKTLKAVLDAVLTPLGYGYEINLREKIVKIVSVETRVYQIPYPNKREDFSFAVGSSGMGGGSGSDRISINEDFWNNLKQNIQNLLSGNGKVIVDPRQGLVIVTDHPSNLEKVEEYIDYVKQRVKQVCRFRLGIYEITYDSQHSTGIDWRRVFYDENGKQGVISYSANEGNVYSFTLSWSKNAPYAFDFALKLFASYGKVNTIYDQYVNSLCGDTVAIVPAEEYRYLEKVEVQTGYQSGLVTKTPIFNTLYLGPQVYIKIDKVSPKRYYALVNIVDKYIKSFRTYTFDQNTYNFPERVGSNQIKVTTFLNKGQLQIIAGFKHYKYSHSQSGIPGLVNIPLISSTNKQQTLSEYIILLQPY